MERERMFSRSPSDTELSWRNRGTKAAVALSAMAALLVLDGQLGPLSLTTRRAIPLGILGPIAAIKMASVRRPFAGWLVIGVSLAILSRTPSTPIALAGLAALVAAIEIVSGSRPASGLLPPGLSAACLSYIMFRFAGDLVPQAGAAMHLVERAARAYIKLVAGREGQLSLTALGGPAIAMAISFLIWNWRGVGGLAAPVAAFGLPLGWFALLPFVTPDASAGPLTVFSRGAIHAMLWLVGAGAIAALPLVRPRATVASSASVRSFALAVAGCAMAAAGVCLTGTGLIGPPSGLSIRVHNFGGLDWDRLEFGKFGPFSGGMFGLLPVYCRADGYDFGVIEHSRAIVAAEGPPSTKEPSTRKVPEGVKSFKGKANPAPARNGPSSTLRQHTGGGWQTTDPSRDARASTRIALHTGMVVSRYTDAIEPIDLLGVQILVLINSPKKWSDADRRLVLNWVGKGGSLLVLGDHTDVFGLMQGFNTLLAPIGIEFHFDSAYRARETWRGCQVAAPDAVTRGWETENPGVAVGASLGLSRQARPLLIGRYAFSDAGIRENVMGSFLGNYHYDQGEQLGDVVLAATATHGRGRIVVWGDTSAFQGGLSTNYRTVVGPMLAWLSRPAAWTERPLNRMAAAIGLVVSIMWFWIIVPTLRQVIALSVSLVLGMVIPWAVSLPNLIAQPRFDRDAFLIDRSHMEATGHYEARANPIGPLYTNLRSGFRVVDMDQWDLKAIGQARGVAFVAPQKSFTRREVGELLRAEDDGAVVILTTGQPDSEGSRPLLAAHGLILAPRPMGTITPSEPTASRGERERQPRFLDAWPIVALGEKDPTTLSDVEVIYRHGDDVVALFRHMGKGGLLLISDTRFFSDVNVEDVSGYRVGNLALIHDLFKRYLGADPDAVKPLFRSPAKPQ
jgi:hypothetical protein